MENYQHNRPIGIEMNDDDLKIDSIAAALGEVSDAALSAASKALPQLTFGGIVPAGVAVGITIISSITKKKLYGKKNELETLVDTCIDSCKLSPEVRNWCKPQIVDLFSSNSIDVEELINNENYINNFVNKISSSYAGLEKEIVMSVSIQVFKSLSVAIRTTPQYRQLLEEKLQEIDNRLGMIEQKNHKTNTSNRIPLNKSAITAEIEDICFLLNDNKTKICLEVVLANRTQHLVCINNCIINSEIEMAGAGFSPYMQSLSYSVDLPYFFNNQNESMIFDGKIHEADEEYYEKCSGIYDFKIHTGCRTWSVIINLPIHFTIESGRMLRVRFYFSKPKLTLVIENKSGEMRAFTSLGELSNQTILQLKDTDGHAFEYSKDDIASHFLEFFAREQTN